MLTILSCYLYNLCLGRGYLNYKQVKGVVLGFYNQSSLCYVSKGGLHKLNSVNKYTCEIEQKIQIHLT